MNLAPSGMSQHRAHTHRPDSRYLLAFGILPGVIAGLHKQLTWCLFALMLVIIRTADAHAHLCQDGKEPPAAIHLADGGTHACEAEESPSHLGDEDISLAHDIFLKKSSLDELWIPLVVPLAALRDFVPTEEPVLPEITPILVYAPHFIRPPLRGPPA